MPRKRKTKKPDGQVTISTKSGTLHRKQVPDKSTDNKCKSHIKEKKSNYGKLNNCSNIQEKMDTEIINNKHALRKKQVKMSTEDLLRSDIGNITTKRASLRQKRIPVESTGSMCKSDINEKKSNYGKFNTCGNIQEKMYTKIINKKHALRKKQVKTPTEDLLGSDIGNYATKRASLNRKRIPAESTDSMCKSDINEKKSKYGKLNTCSSIQENMDTEVLNNKHALRKKQAKTSTENLLGSDSRNITTKRASLRHKQIPTKSTDSMCQSDINEKKSNFTNLNTRSDIRDNLDTEIINKDHAPSRKQAKTHTNDLPGSVNRNIATKRASLRLKRIQAEAPDSMCRNTKIINNKHPLSTKQKKTHTRNLLSSGNKNTFISNYIKRIIRKSMKTTAIKQCYIARELKSAMKVVIVQQTNEKNPLGSVKENPSETSQKPQLQSHAWRFDSEGAKESNETLAVLEPAQNSLSYSVQTNFIEVPSMSNNFDNGQETCNDKHTVSVNECAVISNLEFCEKDPLGLDFDTENNKEK